MAGKDWTAANWGEEGWNSHPAFASYWDGTTRGKVKRFKRFYKVYRFSFSFYGSAQTAATYQVAHSSSELGHRHHGLRCGLILGFWHEGTEPVFGTAALSFLTSAICLCESYLFEVFAYVFCSENNPRIQLWCTSLSILSSYLIKAIYQLLYICAIIPTRLHTPPPRRKEGNKPVKMPPISNYLPNLI